MTTNIDFNRGLRSIASWNNKAFLQSTPLYIEIETLNWMAVNI